MKSRYSNDQPYVSSSNSRSLDGMPICLAADGWLSMQPACILPLQQPPCPFSSSHQALRCSNHSRMPGRASQVIRIVTKFLLDHGLTGKPVYLWGASSGGTLALKLPGALQVAAKQAKEGEYTLKVDGIISGAP